MTEFEISLIVVFVPLGLALLGFWIWMLVDCLGDTTDSPGGRIAWVLVIVFLKVVGAAVYYFCRYRPRGPSTARGALGS